MVIKGSAPERNRGEASSSCWCGTRRKEGRGDKKKRRQRGEERGACRGKDGKTTKKGQGGKNGGNREKERAR